MRTRGHQVTFRQDEEQARAAIERAFAEAGLAVPSVAEVLAKSGVEAARARALLALLLREKRLARINDELVFHHSAIESLRGLLAAQKGAALRRGRFQGMDRRIAKICHPAAGIFGPGARHPAGGGRTGGALR